MRTGVQPQTRVLMQALQRLGIPALLFVNKIDRPGASEERVLRVMSERLSPAIVPTGFTHGLGTRLPLAAVPQAGCSACSRLTTSSASLTCWSMLVIELKMCRTVPVRSMT